MLLGLARLAWQCPTRTKHHTPKAPVTDDRGRGAKKSPAWAYLCQPPAMPVTVSTDVRRLVPVLVIESGRDSSETRPT